MLQLLIFVSGLALALCADYYDRSSQFHPTGRIIATELAKQVVAEKGGPVCAIKCRDGVILSASRRTRSNNLMVSSAQKIFHVDRHITVAASGMISHSSHYVDLAKFLCTEHKHKYSSPIPIEKLCDQLACRVHEFTRGKQGGQIPYISMVVCGWDEELGPQIYTVDPEGSSKGWNAVAIGVNSYALLDQLAKIVEEEQPSRRKKNLIAQNTVHSVWPKFKAQILKKYFGDNNDESETLSGRVSDEPDLEGTLPGGSSEWSNEVYSCLKASTGEVCWSKVSY